MIPEFRDDGYLPEGLHRATEAEVIFRFGGASRKRQHLAVRLRRWTRLCRSISATHFFVDGSFVTAKVEPGDIDAVVWLPKNFAQLVTDGNPDAVELEFMLATRSPEELFAAEDCFDWDEWLEFFGMTRESDQRRKGLVELEL